MEQHLFQDPLIQWAVVFLSQRRERVAASVQHWWCGFSVIEQVYNFSPGQLVI